MSHRFGALKLFKPVGACVSSGQILVVTGSNGSGKSTLLKMIAGLLVPDAGTIVVRLDNALLDSELRRDILGYVAPDLSLYRELTGAENLRFFAEAKGVDLPRADLIDLLAEVGLKGRGRDFVGTYSSGMRQRLKYAFALLSKPPLLLLDEPTANLDSEGFEMVERVIRRQIDGVENGLTIVATNEPRETDWSDNRVHLEPFA